MLIHPELRALRDDDSPQRAAQDALYASLAVWRVRPEVAAVLAAIDRFASFAPLTECPALAALFRAGDPSARRLADSFSAATANALALSPLGHVPLRHNIDGKSSTLALARKGNVALMLVATTNEALAGATRKVGVSFGPSESWEHVLAGSAKGESIECCIAGSRTALLERRAIALSPGCVVALSGERRALRLREIEGCLVSLRLQRRQANAGASREYDLDTGELIHQAAGNPRDSRVELMMALLGRMGRTDAAVGLEECVDALRATGFNPGDEECLDHAALWLRRLGNNRTFLGDLLAGELAEDRREESGDDSYGPQAIVLSRPGESNFFLRANIWASADEHALRASGGRAFAYAMPHDHNFDFLTLGYFGPGYWSTHYLYDYAAVAGWSGEKAALRFAGRSRLEQGMIQLYRAHLDVHDQAPPDALSVSLNIMHTGGAQGWLDQYAFDLDKGRIKRIVSNGSSEAFVHIAVGLGSEEALDLAQAFARGHPSDRMRLACWQALAAREEDLAARDALWRKAEGAGSRLVAGEARARRAALASVRA
jgi:hypothetical protein